MTKQTSTGTIVHSERGAQHTSCRVGHCLPEAGVCGSIGKFVSIVEADDG